VFVISLSLIKGAYHGFVSFRLFVESRKQYLLQFFQIAIQAIVTVLLPVTVPTVATTVKVLLDTAVLFTVTTPVVDEMDTPATGAISFQLTV
jgi:hypothetical protein